MCGMRGMRSSDRRLVTGGKTMFQSYVPVLTATVRSFSHASSNMQKYFPIFIGTSLLEFLLGQHVQPRSQNGDLRHPYAGAMLIFSVSKQSATVIGRLRKTCRSNVIMCHPRRGTKLYFQWQWRRIYKSAIRKLFIVNCHQLGETCGTLSDNPRILVLRVTTMHALPKRKELLGVEKPF